MVAVLAAFATAATVGAPLEASASSASYRFHHITEPVAGQACRDVDVVGINDHGDLVGTLNCNGAGMFITVDGRKQLIRLPITGSRYSKGTALASNGIAAGVTVRGNRYWRSWLHYPNGKLVKIIEPKADHGYTKVTGVNRHGEAVGGYVADARYPDETTPFVYEPGSSGGSYRTIHLGIEGAWNVEVTGVNDHGVVCGRFRDDGGQMHGFLFRDGHGHVVDVPNAPTGQNDGTALVAVANNGTYVAVTTDSSNLSQPATSYVHSSDGWSEVGFPSSWRPHVGLTGLNNAGQVVGIYLNNATSSDESFVGKPA